MDLTILPSAVSFALAAIALCAVPGPGIANLLVIARTQSFGNALVYSAGMILGLTLAALVSGLGLFSLLQQVPSAIDLLNVAALAYFLYLAIKIATAKVGGTEEEGSSVGQFVAAIMLGLVNPKGYVVFISLFASHTIIQGAADADLAVKVSLIFLSLVVVSLSWVLIGRRLKKAGLSRLQQRLTNLTLAGLVLVAAASMLSF